MQHYYYKCIDYDQSIYTEIFFFSEKEYVNENENWKIGKKKSYSSITVIVLFHFRVLKIIMKMIWGRYTDVLKYKVFWLSFVKLLTDNWFNSFLEKMSN